MNENCTDQESDMSESEFNQHKKLVVNEEKIPHFSANKFLFDLVNEEKKLLDRVLCEDEEKTKLILGMIEENDEIQHTIFQEARELLCVARDQSKGVLEQQEALTLDFEYKKRRLNSWSEELNKREASLTEEKRKKDLRNNEMGEKIREAEENYRRLVERLKEKEVALSNLEDIHKLIVSKERQKNDELQQVRLELIKLISDLPSSRQVDYGVKRIGESCELWNFRDNRKATLTEIISYINGRTCAGPSKFDAT